MSSSASRARDRPHFSGAAALAANPADPDAEPQRYRVPDADGHRDAARQRHINARSDGESNRNGNAHPDADLHRHTHAAARRSAPGPPRGVPAAGRVRGRGAGDRRLHHHDGWAAWAEVFRGCARIEHGEVAEGLAQLNAGLAAYRAMGQAWALTLLLAMRAHGHLAAGEAEPGLAAIDEALALMNANHERFYEAEIRRLRGELLVFRADGSSAVETRQADLAAAAASFDRACHVARRQGARSLALRAAVSRARLADRLGVGDEARAVLREMVATFDEGRDTLDMEEARWLLAETSALPVSRSAGVAEWP